jgi:hypothetical protein
VSGSGCQRDARGSQAPRSARWRCHKNARAFRKQLAPFVEHARKAGRRQRRPRTSPSRQRSGDIRTWANEHGIAITGRGRIPASVVEQYEAATRGS